ncbi:hypothetical protein BDW02DRAFT_595014 [Decorospora gaudefroyi]|uniref:Uncharacterized protein n=1 Tax=Decorospora gaudefroyi TaxID=184978 RepID=A0A6A5KPS5_9PLEO|nr:hypothetical protein BDW02DRAFT_595014 [Decorospora gaudefroyi]
MVDLESPTMPSTPVLRAASLNWTAASSCTIQSNQPTCCVCFERLHRKTAATIEHINKCWDQIRAEAQTLKAKRTKEIDGAEMKASENKDSKSTEPELLTRTEQIRDVTPDPHPVLSSQRPNPMAERAGMPPRTRCRSYGWVLSSMDAIDLFHHRMSCDTVDNLQACPTCNTPFVNNATNDAHSFLLQKAAIVQHVHACKYGNQTTQANHEPLVAAWCGRLESARRRAEREFGLRKEWDTRTHRRSFRWKMENGSEYPGAVYGIPSSRLRVVTNVVSARVFETVRCVKTTVPDYIPMAPFRRCPFSVLEIPGSTKIPYGLRAETVVRNHWSLVAMDWRAKTSYYYDSM